MKRILVLSLFIFISISSFPQKSALHHILDVQLDPAQSHIKVTDSILVLSEKEILITLNSALKILSFSSNVKAEQLAGTFKSNDVGMDRDNGGENTKVKLNKWKLILDKDSKYFVINYEGNVNFSFSQSEEDYARGFSETSGIISDSGIYLAGSTHWVPSFNDRLVTFQMTTSLPQGWKSVSQGKRLDEATSEGRHYDTWICEHPQEEIFLIGARFIEYAYEMSNGIHAMAFLRTPDEALANKYLEVTGQYMDMYQKLIGSYPYSKFALVENFWETGYGMPSFTLLGEKIIRFPFILHSSYPHELLHNWWGNSVYVNFEKGNWCEGITAYGADHLISEQRGQGEEYRRAILQKFTNVVNPGNDFPLNRFISRNSAASEAIGYGKSLMMWHMLRLKVGDEAFKKSFVHFYNEFRFRVASFQDIQKSFELVTQKDLQTFFTQWLTRTGAPEIGIKEATFIKDNPDYKVSLTLEQKQSVDPFNVDIPVGIATKNGVKTFVVNMTKKIQKFEFMLLDEPLKLEVDPQYDVFRIMDPLEVPPTWSKILASRDNLVVLPSKAGPDKQSIYSDFIERWNTMNPNQFDIVFDNEVTDLPKNKTVWIIGFENRFAEAIQATISKNKSSILGDSVIFDHRNFPKTNHSFVFTVFNPQNSNFSMAFIAIDNKDAIEGLVRKLPHYGKYSYLGFEGAEPANVAKGEWPVSGSPLIKLFSGGATDLSTVEKRTALATFDPLFSEKKMMDHIDYLASEALKGRGLGTPELDSAANYIARKFKIYGLAPLENSYFQEFSHTFSDKDKMRMKNVIGVIQGTDKDLMNHPVVVSAHYDHLGMGWPDAHKGDEGKIHYGADDNASGVSILLELARTMGTSVKPKRTIVFVAFTGEEAGLIGSRYFIGQAKNYFPGEIIANINLDTDGSLFDKKLMVLNGNSAKEWKFIFMGTDYTTGIKSEVIQQELDASDQVAFIEKGIPGVQLFTGATANYHRPTDTKEKIDGKGLVKVATVTKEVLLYLADRDTPLTFTGQASEAGSTSTSEQPTRREASTGSVPDFSFTGKGVKISSVMEGSAGEKAGLKAGDIIIALNGNDLDDLKAYSNTLKLHNPGDVVELKIVRNGKTEIIPITLGAR
ncbi:MAG: M20/M25/M40 family metallo-hydrolase [Lentimicrobiaceae bacterium]|nr:M20/M25/M40 family metallo-hydrolase [Lentimicrobiaceae bacterium]